MSLLGWLRRFHARLLGRTEPVDPPADRPWTFEDYEVTVEFRETLAGQRIGTLVVCPYLARIAGWPEMNAAGATREEAIEGLRVSFEHFAAGHALPRPGTAAMASAWTIAPADEIEKVEETAYELATFLWGGVGFLTDESMLRDGRPSAKPGELAAEVLERYGVDISDLEAPTVLEVARRIEAARTGA